MPHHPCGMPTFITEALHLVSIVQLLNTYVRMGLMWTGLMDWTHGLNWASFEILHTHLKLNN